MEHNTIPPFLLMDVQTADYPQTAATQLHSIAVSSKQEPQASNNPVPSGAERAGGKPRCRQQQRPQPTSNGQRVKLCAIKAVDSKRHGASNEGNLGQSTTTTPNVTQQSANTTSRNQHRQLQTALSRQ
jgi:hypothetical protein